MTTQSDRTVNKVAMCGALVAGFAYVGYKVVKNFRSKKSKTKDGNALLDYEDHKRGRIYLRRLSGSECSALASEVLFKGQDLNDNKNSKEERAKMFFRPLSVQERIRELNLRARHFAETILAVQLYDSHHTPAPPGAQSSISLQPSPTHSGAKLFSPIEITQLGSSRCNSIENLAFSESSSLSSLSLPDADENGFRRGSRSLRRRNPSVQSLSKEELDQTMEYESERMLDERESELKRRLQGFESGTTRILTPYEAKSLVALLHTNECDILERALITVSNSCAFSANHESLRDAGAVLRLQTLINHPDRAVKLAAISATANMALNIQNQQIMDKTVPSLLVNLDPPFNSDDEMLAQTLLALTNVAALNDWHLQFTSGIHKIWDLLSSEDSKRRVLSLRLLINLSTNHLMTSHLMNPAIPGRLWDMLDMQTEEGELLRAVTLMVNIVSGNKRSNGQNGVENGGSRRSLRPYGLMDKDQSVVLPRIAKLMLSHPHEDIRQKSRSLLNLLKEA